MPSLCLFGAQWGDEGKGKIIDALADEVDVVVRYQGGSNAGHTVVVGSESYVLHLVPSGILHPEKVNVIGCGVAVDPLALFREIGELRARGVRVTPENLRVSARAHVIFEHHRRLDMAAEHWRGLGRIGTTGRGIGPCYADKAARTGLRFADLLDPELARRRLKPVLAEKNAALEEIHGAEPLELEAELARMLGVVRELAAHVGDTGAWLRDAARRGARILFEGAQGVLLDIDAGTYPYVTSSNTSPAGVASGASFPPNRLDRALGIAKAYCTRVGEGPFPTEEVGAVGERLRAAGGEYGATTGRPRRCGWFDVVAARYALELSGAEGLVLTKLDVLTGFETIPVGVAYRDGERRFERYPAERAQLDGLEVEYARRPGWSADLSAARHWQELPGEVRAYVEWIETQVGVPIVMLSVGPGRDQLVRCDPQSGGRGPRAAEPSGVRTR